MAFRRASAAAVKHWPVTTAADTCVARLGAITRLMRIDMQRLLGASRRPFGHLQTTLLHSRVQTRLAFATSATSASVVALSSVCG